MSRFRILPLVIASALFMEQMDSTIIATSLPAIAADLGTSPVTLKLAFTTYLLGLTVFLPVSGWMADRFGARLVFRLAIIVFTAGSVACGFAESLGWLVTARAVQGAGGAMMVPVGRIILLRSVPKAELVDALAWLTVPALIGPTIGPPVGGFITTYLDWRYVFWMNLPFGLLAFGLATALMPPLRDEAVPPLDLKGFILSGAGLTLSVFGFTIMGRDLLPGWAVASMMVMGVLLLFFYVKHARGMATPILDLRILRVPTFRHSVVGGSLFRISVGAAPFLMPLMLQLGFGLSAFQSGLITCASTFGAVMMKFTAARFIRRFGFRELLMINGTLACVAMAASGFVTATTPALVIAGILVINGFLRSLQFTALNAMAYADISRSEMSRANALYTVIQQLSLAGGVAVAAFLLDAQMWVAGRTTLASHDFGIAIALVAIFSAFAVLSYRKLAPGAGASVSGRVTETAD